MFITITYLHTLTARVPRSTDERADGRTRTEGHDLHMICFLPYAAAAAHSMGRSVIFSQKIQIILSDLDLLD